MRDAATYVEKDRPNRRVQGQPLNVRTQCVQMNRTCIFAPSPSEVEDLLSSLHLDVAFRCRAEDEVDHFALLLDLACYEFASGVDDFEEPALVILAVQRVEDESREILRSRGRVERVVPLITTHDGGQLLRDARRKSEEMNALPVPRLWLGNSAPPCELLRCVAVVPSPRSSRRRCRTRPARHRTGPRTRCLSLRSALVAIAGGACRPR
jgi:hypothetical protein